MDDQDSAEKELAGAFISQYLLTPRIVPDVFIGIDEKGQHYICSEEASGSVFKKHSLGFLINEPDQLLKKAFIRLFLTTKIVENDDVSIGNIFHQCGGPGAELSQFDFGECFSGTVNLDPNYHTYNASFERICLWDYLPEIFLRMASERLSELQRNSRFLPDFMRNYIQVSLDNCHLMQQYLQDGAIHVPPEPVDVYPANKNQARMKP